MTKIGPMRGVVAAGDSQTARAGADLLAQGGNAIDAIVAAGDVNGLSMLVPSAWHEGRIASENAVLGTRRHVNHDIVPAGSFTDPEYGSVGLSEEQARERYDCAVAVVRYVDLLRPVADGRADGFCKLIVERERRRGFDRVDRLRHRRTDSAVV